MITDIKFVQSNLNILKDRENKCTFRATTNKEYLTWYHTAFIYTTDKCIHLLILRTETITELEANQSCRKTQGSKGEKVI